MNKPPKVISTKDLNYIHDMLHWNLVASKKAHHFSEEVNDEEIKDILDRVSELHKEHYNFILNLIK